MSQLEQIRTAQENLEDCFSKRMADLEAQLHAGGPSKDTVAKVAEEFRAFRELMFSMLGLLRKQIEECATLVDNIESRQRRKALIFLGIPEEKEDCRAAILDVVHKLGQNEVTATNFADCHRIGTQNKDHHRPILVKFSGVDIRAAVWRAKSRLKGSSVAVREFLTKTRQTVFAKARLHFGMRACWTQDGIVVVKVADGTRRKITTMHQLNTLTLQYPKPLSASLPASKTGVVPAASTVTLNACAKQRK